MNHTRMNHEHGVSENWQYSLKDFVPLIGAFIAVFALTFILIFVFNARTAIEYMKLFMGSFFVIFGILKIVNIQGFAEAYSMYDIISKRFKTYGYIYPCIELGLGVAYIAGLAIIIINWITLVVMLVSALGVFLKLREGEVVPCACLGVVFKVPMTWVTLFEDLLMAFMATFILFGL